MKIKKIKLNNIGPYVEENEFNFEVADSVKRMVLIGGKNGAGKTTLFNAIKICLYGCVAYGYESNTANYYAEVSKIINTAEKMNDIGNAGVTIDLLLDDGKYDYTYTFNRRWRTKGSRITENFSVSKNGKLLSENEKGDFESYLLQLLPPNLFRFYFFDGEKLNDFTFNNGKNSDFRDAFLKLCNLDTLEIIKDNFRRTSRGKTPDSIAVIAEYDRCVEEDNLKAQRIIYAEEDYKEISNDISLIEDKLASLEKIYAKEGGISKKEWRSMQTQLVREEARREERRKWLKEFANNILPFIILKNELSEVQNQINNEHKHTVAKNVKDTIGSPEINKIISDVLKNSGVGPYSDIAKKIIYEISNHSNETDNTEMILNLSDSDRFELNAKINSLLAFDINRVKEVTDDITASLNCAKRIRTKMERSSIDNYDDYLKEKSDLNEQKSQHIQRLLELDKELQKLREEKAVTSTRLAKAKGAYETLLKKQSVNDISSRALLAFEDLQKVLYAQNIKIVERGFEVYFKALINKTDLIDGIHIDDNLNVFPYKYKTFFVNDLRKTLARNGAEYLIAQIGLYAYEVLQEKLNGNEEDIVLPVEVKQQLSAGEKQIFVMALYQSLSQLNKINVPYIIDTPFARIDTEHRRNILEQFFKRLKGQVIILSTDEEVSTEYVDVISDVISNKYVLNHSNEGFTEIIPDAYFGGIL